MMSVSICAFAGWGGMMEIWPAILVAGVSYAIPQYFISNYHGPWLANIGASVVSMICLVAFLFAIYRIRETAGLSLEEIERTVC